MAQGRGETGGDQEGAALEKLCGERLDLHLMAVMVMLVYVDGK